MERFLQTIILLGVIQGFIVSGLLFFSTRHRQSNRLLAALIFLLTMASFSLCGAFYDWFHSPWLNFITQLLPLITVMPVGPLLYFYIQSMLNPDFKLGKSQWWQLSTMIIDFGAPLTGIIFVVGVLTGLLKNHPQPWGIFMDTYNIYADIPRWMSMAVYTGLSFRYVTAYKRTLQPNHRLQWAQQLILAFAGFSLLWLVYLVPYVIPRYTDMMLDTFDWYPLYIPITVLIYWLGIKGYIISYKELVSDKKTETVLPETTVIPALALLKKAMEEDLLYLNTALTLQMVAQHTGLPPKTISAVLNQHAHKNFNEFVNSYRVDLFKEKLLQEEAGQLTFAGIAYDCGFSSPATFQRVFKQLTGMSPSAYRKSVPPLDK
ncbi:helix-turn-helix domain-containing protein [Chitinophaga arvensicola]|uniref:AraC-type DNA-binding protein n=1 Tax=Chitinophaga arvensicola TaxID=29529 RepID=A0A1I0S800_9BACT|nr:helix-turn-helix domain-containing protein [Chitinophaga arvensicola]SEW51990.1 AraC-type DNA-binding protein [Chitinophaga arvensicola]